VFPEHKYAIVKALQARGHLVAMTGDGVNDAPALKQADCGTAVSGATDAARGVAALVLTAPGLSVINDAIDEARRIFGRITTYTIYRIALTMDIMFNDPLSRRLAIALKNQIKAAREGFSHVASLPISTQHYQGLTGGAVFSPRHECNMLLAFPMLSRTRPTALRLHRTLPSVSRRAVPVGFTRSNMTAIA